MARAAVSGASGLIGAALSARLSAGGVEAVPLTRRRGAPGVFWSPESGEVDAAGLEGLDAVFHLAGVSVAARWSAGRKAAIRDSRVRGTALLARALAGLSRRPKVLVCASAVGWYGSRAEPVDETAAPGTGFLAEVCRDWEAAARPAAEAGIRVVHARLGMVLSRAGGALQRMLPAFRLGLGGPIGSGAQGVSWVTLEDCAAALSFLAFESSLSGPVNVAAPDAVPNAEFARALGRALHRPAFLPLPAFAVRLVLGEMAEELLLSGQRAVPAALTRAGFTFAAPGLDEALRRELGR
ncbi:MAG: TIGR01777 family oxidoreductase [Elusimicrobia bacterium]|nr:TIGR01777 family oxidoreductase [Elusimicrobiota bacterium]